MPNELLDERSVATKAAMKNKSWKPNQGELKIK